MALTLWKRKQNKLELFQTGCWFLFWLGIGFIITFRVMNMGTPNSLARQEINIE